MDFDLSEEQRLLQDSVAKLLADTYGFEQRRAAMKTAEGWSAVSWAQMAELGLLGLPFAEDYGGFGGGPVDVMLLMQAFGLAGVYFNWRKQSIYGGSNEIQRNIMAKAFLGL